MFKKVLPIVIVILSATKLILNCFTNATQFGKCNALPFSVALYQIV